MNTNNYGNNPGNRLSISFIAPKYMLVTITTLLYILTTLVRLHSSPYKLPSSFRSAFLPSQNLKIYSHNIDTNPTIHNGIHSINPTKTSFSEIEMPSLSSTMTEGKIISWKKQVGDKVEFGDPILVVESDKADMEVESFSEGFLAKQIVPEGSLARVGEIIGLVASKKEDINFASEFSAKSTDSNPIKSNFQELPQPIPIAYKNEIKSIPIHMPSLSSTMLEGKIIKWLKAKGDKVEVGDTLMIVESDKADMEVESFEEGYLASIIKEEGETAAVNSEVAFLVEKKESLADFTMAPTSPSTSNMNGQQKVDRIASKIQSRDYIEVGSKMIADTQDTTHIEKPMKQWLQEFTPSSVDQSIYEQIPPGKSEFDLGDIFMERIEYLDSGKKLIQAAKDSPEGMKQLETLKSRAQIRIPPANNLYSNDKTRDSSIWKISGAARAAMHSYKISENEVKGSGMGGRVFLSDIERIIKNKKNPLTESSEYPISITPSAKRFAKSKGIDPSSLIGSGPYNRIIIEDVEKHLGIKPHVQKPIIEATSIPTQPTIEPLTGMRKAIAKNMEATVNTPIFRVTTNIITDKIDDLYSQLKNRGVSLSAILAKAVANTLENHKIMNAAYSNQNGGSIINPSEINIAMAVALDNGLITPVIKNTNKKDLLTISSEWKSLIAKVKANKHTPQDYSGGTFVISNLGMYGITQFDAILPSNTGTIMSIGTTIPRIVESEGSDFITQKEMTITITCDHRHIYGSHAAEFLKDLKKLIETEPLSLLI